jgi:large subunit ribosomal protein L3
MLLSSQYAVRAAVRRYAGTTGVVATMRLRDGVVSDGPSPRQQPATRAAFTGLSIRLYTQTCVLLDKDDDDDEEDIDAERPMYQTLNMSDRSDAELEAIVAEEEAKLLEAERSKYVENWKPGMRKRPLKFSNNLQDFLNEMYPEKYGPVWNLRDKRCGALGIKVGMMPLFDDWGVRHPCTILFLDNNVVLGQKSIEQHGYWAVQIAAGQRKRKNVGVSVLGQYKHILEDENENPPYLVREFRVSDGAHLVPVGARIHARHFVPGQNVDVSGISKGKGFQGAMKRHNFGGMPASHGVSKSHRALGSTGQCQDPGKVFKGKKMAGRMGAERVTVQNLRVVKVDRGRNLLFLEGAVPGNKGAFVEIRDAVKKPLWSTQHVLESVTRPPLPTFECDATIDGCGEAGHDVFMPLPEIDPLDPTLNDDSVA